jgi:hypothetical protein
VVVNADKTQATRGIRALLILNPGILLLGMDALIRHVLHHQSPLIALFVHKIPQDGILRKLFLLQIQKFWANNVDLSGHNKKNCECLFGIRSYLMGTIVLFFECFVLINGE